MSQESSPSVSSNRSRVTRFTSRLKDIKVSPTTVEATIRLSSAANNAFNRTRANTKAAFEALVTQKSVDDDDSIRSESTLRETPETRQSLNKRLSSASQSIIDKTVSNGKTIMERFPTRKNEDALERQISSASGSQSQGRSARISSAAQELFGKTVSNGKTILETVTTWIEIDGKVEGESPISEEIRRLDRHGVELEGMLRSIEGLCANLQKDIEKAKITEEIDSRAGKICYQASEIEQILERKTTKIALCNLPGTDKYDFLKDLLASEFVPCLHFIEDDSHAGLLLELLPAPGKSNCLVEVEFLSSDKAKKVLLDNVELLHAQEEAETDKAQTEKLYQALKIEHQNRTLIQLRDSILAFDFNETIKPLQKKKFRKTANPDSDNGLIALEKHLQLLHCARQVINKVSIYLDSSILSSGIGLVLVPGLAALANSRLSIQHALAGCKEIAFIGNLPEPSKEPLAAETDEIPDTTQPEIYETLETLSGQADVERIYSGQAEAAPRIILLHKISDDEIRGTRQSKAKSKQQLCSDAVQNFQQIANHISKHPEPFPRFHQSKLHLLPISSDPKQKIKTIMSRYKDIDDLSSLELWMKTIGIMRRKEVYESIVRGTLRTLISNTRIWKDEDLDHKVVENAPTPVEVYTRKSTEPEVIEDQSEDEAETSDSEDQESDFDDEEDSGGDDYEMKESETSVSGDEPEVKLTFDEELALKASCKKILGDWIFNNAITGLEERIDYLSKHAIDERRMKALLEEIEEVPETCWSRIAWNTFGAACAGDGVYNQSRSMYGSNINLNKHLAGVLSESLAPAWADLADWAPPKFTSLSSTAEKRRSQLPKLPFPEERLKNIMIGADSVVAKWVYKLRYNETIRTAQYNMEYEHRQWFQNELGRTYRKASCDSGPGVKNRRIVLFTDTLALKKGSIKQHIQNLIGEVVVEKLRDFYETMKKQLKKDLQPFLASLDLDFAIAKAEREKAAKAEQERLAKSEREKAVKAVRAEKRSAARRMVDAVPEASGSRPARKQKWQPSAGENDTSNIDRQAENDLQGTKAVFTLTKEQAETIMETKNLVFEKYYKYMTVLESKAIGSL